MHKKKISVVITDLDNTLFDWFDIWYYPFSAMLDKLVADSGVSREALLREVKAVHEKHGTAEYAFLIEELPLLRAKHPAENLVEVYAEAIAAYRQVRRQHMHLYPGVMNSLNTLKDRGCLIVGYTESMAFYTNYRVRKLELDGLLDYLYSPADHDLPMELTPDQIRKYPSEQYELKYTKHRHTPHGELKPNPKVLLDIIRDIGAEPHQCLYIGDSLFKDVVMAKDACVTDVFAKYGTAHAREEYELLRAVTHWSDEQVEQERKIRERHVSPTHTCHASFCEILALFQFESFSLSLKDRESQVVDIWKKTIDVQQHFNSIALQIRNFAITILGAFLAATSLALKENLFIEIFGVSLSLATFLCLGASLVWTAFFFMDRYWYHQLLIGAVKYGKRIEQENRHIFGQEGLTTTIGDASPINFLHWRIHSKSKFYVFYGAGAAVLLLLALLLSFARPATDAYANRSHDIQPQAVDAEQRPAAKAKP